MSVTKSPSVGGVPLEVESTEVETKPQGGKFSFGPRKAFMTLWNLKAFILVIWGFYSMLSSTMQAGNMKEFGEFISDGFLNHERNSASWADEYSCAHFTKTDVNPEYHSIECYHKEEVKQTIKENAYPLFFPFLFLNVAWMLWICIQSKMLWYRTDELGFHVCWVEIRKKRSYKAWALIDGIYCFGVMLYGFQAISGSDDEESKGRILPVFLNGFFQVFLGLWDLYSPLEETISFGQGAMNSSLKCGLFTEAGKAINKYQDAMLAALTRNKSNMTWIEKATGATKSECEQVLFEITANDHPDDKEKKGFSFC